MNEGWATFWHHRLLNTMYDEGFLADGVMVEWLTSHTNVIYQPPVGHRAYSGINPYALGFAMYNDLKRICDEKESELEVSAIHDEAGYRRVREALAHQYDLGAREPNIQVWNVNLRGDRSLTLRHTQHNDRPLDDSAQEVLRHVARLWGFGVHLESVDSSGDVTKRWSVAPPES
jgi:stage V sporulation protein R